MTMQIHTDPVSRTYARALLEAAGAAKREDVGRELVELVELVRSEANFRTFLETPAIDVGAKKQVLESLRGHFGDLLVNFACVVVDKGRTDKIEEMAAAYRELLDEAAGRVRVRVTTAVPLSDDLRRQVHDRIAQRLGKSIVLETQIDSGLIGGMVVQAGDTVYEASVRGWLKSMHRDMVRSSGYEDQG